MTSRFPFVTPGMERFSLDFPRAVKIENVLWNWSAGVCLDRDSVEFLTAD